MILEPAFDLVHQEELRFGVAEQVEDFDRWFSPFNDIFESLVGFLETFKGRVLIYVREPLTIKLIMESFQSVSELGPRRHVFGSLTHCMFRFAVFDGSLRALRCQALLWRLIFFFISFDLLCSVGVKSMLHVVIYANLVRIDKLFPRVLFLKLSSTLHFTIDAIVAFFVCVRNSVLCFSLYFLDLTKVDILCWCLSLKAL